MTASRYIANYNPILFLQEFEEAVNDGYYADNSVIGYPQLAALNEINVFQIDKPETRNQLDDSIHTLVVEGFDSTTFMLDVQDAILQGFYADTQSASLGVTYAPHTVTLRKAARATLNLTPVAQDTQDGEDAVESATAAPKATSVGKQTRKQKSKEV